MGEKQSLVPDMSFSCRTETVVRSNTHNVPNNKQARTISRRKTLLKRRTLWPQELFSSSIGFITGMYVCLSIVETA